jgi:hypothetical protein
MDEPIPVGETITLDWPSEAEIEAQMVDWLTRPCMFDRIRVAPVNEFRISAGKFLESLTLTQHGKPAPTGILTVHEGRVGGVPMCAE